MASAPPYDPPLNGLLVARDGREGCVIESTLSGKPTPQAPHVASQYMVMWDDGKKEGGLSRAAVVEMSTQRWSCPAWQDMAFEASLPSGFRFESGAKAGGFNLATLYSPDTLTAGITACIAPPPSAPPGAAKKPASAYALGQDKSRIANLFRPPARSEAPNVLSQGRNPKTPASAPASKAPAASTEPKASGARKATPAKKGKRKARSDSESDGEAELPAEDPEDEEEPEVDDPFERQYPRDVCFKPGDIPLIDYKDKDPGDVEFEVESIVDEVVLDRKKFVLVKWKGYELDVEDWSNLSDVKHLDIYKAPPSPFPAPLLLLFPIFHSHSRMRCIIAAM